VNNLLPKQSVKGKGLVDSFINNLPFELHLPGGYQYAGPGTNLELRLEKGIKPKNKLDEAAMFHDIAYNNSKSLEDRHVADKKLEEEAWKRVKASDAGLGEKALGWLVTNTKKAKRSLGAGLSRKTQYVDFPVNLSVDQREKLVKAITKKQKSVSITINKTRDKDSIQSGLTLPLTKTQIQKITQSNKPTIKLAETQLKKIKSGGFLPALIAAAPAVASVLGTIYNSYNNKKTNDRLIEERIRHNKEMKGSKGAGVKKKKAAPKKNMTASGLYLNKKPKGEGVKKKKAAPKKKMTASGLYLNKKPKGEGVKKKKSPPKGNGLYQQLFRKKRTRSK
jgi:hypothetical protein